jgi:hypothetical protein
MQFCGQQFAMSTQTKTGIAKYERLENAAHIVNTAARTSNTHTRVHTRAQE